MNTPDPYLDIRPYLGEILKTSPRYVDTSHITLRELSEIHGEAYVYAKIDQYWSDYPGGVGDWHNIHWLVANT